MLHAFLRQNTILFSHQPIRRRPRSAGAVTHSLMDAASSILVEVLSEAHGRLLKAKGGGHHAGFHLNGTQILVGMTTLVCFALLYIWAAAPKTEMERLGPETFSAQAALVAQRQVMHRQDMIDSMRTD